MGLLEVTDVYPKPIHPFYSANTFPYCPKNLQDHSLASDHQNPELTTTR